MDITQITPDVHLLPGIGDIEYIYNKEAKELSINIDGEEIKSFTGDDAQNIHKDVIGAIDALDETELKLERMIRETWGAEWNLDRIRQRSRDEEVREKRQICMWYLAHNSKKSLKAIGGLLGGYKHETVGHARDTINNLIEIDMDFKRNIEIFLKTA